MAANDNAALVRSVYTAYNDRDFDRAANAVTDDFEWTMIPTGQTFHGPNGMRQYLEAWAGGFPDSNVDVTNVIAQENGVMLEFTGHGTHTGTMVTPGGEIPATGKQVELRFSDVYEIRNGKLASGRTYFDMATLMLQLGLMT